MGEREKQLEQARQALETLASVEFQLCSKVYETEPVGGPEQGKYLNAVWQIETRLSPQELLNQLLSVEKSLGRVRGEVNGPRTLDLDILFYDDEIIEQPNLKIPHPRLHERTFVLEPFCDLAPEFVHPVKKKTIKQLFEETLAKN